jgi:hypothetical protein
MDEKLSESAEADIVKRVEKRHSEACEAKSSVILDMQLAYRQYKGEQFTWREKNRIRSMDKDEERLREELQIYAVKKNKIKPAVDTVVSRLTQRQPQLLCNAKASSDTARKRAKIWSDVLTFYRLRKQYLRLDIECAEWTVRTGKGYKWVHPVTDEEGNVISVDLTVLSGFHFCGCPGVREINRMPWCGVEQYIPQDSLEEAFGVKVPPMSQSDGSLVEAMIALTDVKNLEKMCQVFEYLEKPTKKTPRGARFLIAGGKVLEPGEFPYWDKRGGKEVWGGYRIRDYSYRQDLLTHWATGLPDDVLNSQKRINQLLTQWATYVILTAGSKGFYEKIDALSGKFTDNYPGMFPIRDLDKIPRWMETPKNSPEMKVLLGALEAAFDEQAGVHPMTMGEEPMKRMPYLAVQYLTEMDMDKFRPMFDLWEESDRDTGMNILAALQQYGEVPLLAILGEGRKDDVGMILDDDLGDMELDVERGSSMPQSRAGQIGQALDSLKYGAFNMENPVDRLAFLKAMQSGWAQGMVEDELRSTDFAEEENRRLLKDPPLDSATGQPMLVDPATGQPMLNVVPVSPYHNHPAHIHTHSKPLDGPEYFAIAGTIKEASVQAHIQEHERMMAEKMAAQAPPPELAAEAPPMEAPLPPPGPPGMGMPPGLELPPEAMAGMGQLEDQTVGEI